jgi:hypothetical protein
MNMGGKNPVNSYGKTVLISMFRIIKILFCILLAIPSLYAKGEMMYGKTFINCSIEGIK